MAKETKFPPSRGDSAPKPTPAAPAAGVSVSGNTGPIAPVSAVKAANAQSKYSITKSVDPTWPRWGVMIREEDTKWFGSLANARAYVRARTETDALFDRWKALDDRESSGLAAFLFGYIGSQSNSAGNEFRRAVTSWFELATKKGGAR